MHRMTTKPRIASAPTVWLLIGLVLAPGATHALSGMWAQLTSYPIPISNNAVASVCDQDGCTIYSFMGIVDPFDSTSITAASYKLDSPGTGPWQPLADAPLLNGRSKIAATAITVAGEVYLIGGYTVGGGPEVTEKRLFRYDPSADMYIQLADVPTEVDDTVAGVYLDRYIYLISGWHGPINDNTMAVQLYDTQLDLWRQATPIPVGGRFGHAGGLVDGRLVFIDGAADKFGFPLVHSTLVGVIDPADPTVVTWSQPGPSPFSGTYRAASTQGLADCGRVLFVGGTDNTYNFSGNGYNGQPSQPLDQVMTYEPALDRWAMVADGGGDPWTPTMDHRGLVQFDHRWVTVGGMTGPGASTPTVNALGVPDLCGLLFEDGFESGDTAAWSNTTTFRPIDRWADSE